MGVRLSVTSRVHQRAPRRSGLRVGDKPRRARTGVNVRSELSGLRLLPHGPTRRTDRSLAASDDCGCVAAELVAEVVPAVNRSEHFGSSVSPGAARTLMPTPRLTTQDVAPCPVALCHARRSDDVRLLGIQRRLGVGNQRSGTQRMNADQPRPRKNPPMTSVGQCAPAQTRPKQASTITSPAITHTIRRQRGPTCGEIASASMNDSHVK